MAIAQLLALRSTCLRNQIGAVIAKQGRIISTGYNGVPSGLPHCTPDICNEDGPCTRTVHAEANAIVHAAKVGIKTDYATLYTTISPCLDCAKLIINAGIDTVIFDKPYRDSSPIKYLLDAGVAVYPT